MLLTRLTAWEEEVEADGLLERRRRRSTRVLQHFRAFSTSDDYAVIFPFESNEFPGQFFWYGRPRPVEPIEWNEAREASTSPVAPKIKCESRKSGSAAQVQLSQRQMPEVDSVGVSRRCLIYRRLQVFSHFCGSCVKMSKAAEKFCSLRRRRRQLWKCGSGKSELGLTEQ